MLSKHITVKLTNYLFANEGKIAPEREVIFTQYFHSGDTAGLWGTSVTNVRMCESGYVGVDKEGKEITVEEDHATIELPLSILKGA